MNTKESDGLIWVVGDTNDEHLGFMNHEPFMFPLLRELLPPGGVFVDVGAHVGRYSLRMAAYARAVFAWEPHPVHRQLLEQHLRINEIDNVIVVPFGADAGWRAARLELGRGASSGFTWDENVESVPVLTAPLDAICMTADVVKIDVEGHEAQVLKGMKGLLNHCPKIVVEVHPGQKAGVEKFLGDHRYGWQTVGQSGEQEYWLCLSLDSV